MKITIEEQTRIENVFIQRCKNNYIKFKSKKFYELQVEFFSGACAALNEIPVSWGICITSRRKIVTY